MTMTTEPVPVLRASMTMSGLAFVVLWEKLDLGTLPRALFLPSPGTTVADRATAERIAAMELARIGVGWGARLDDEIVASLRLLAAPATEYYGWIMPPTGR